MITTKHKNDDLVQSVFLVHYNSYQYILFPTFTLTVKVENTKQSYLKAPGLRSSKVASLKSPESPDSREVHYSDHRNA